MTTIHQERQELKEQLAPLSRVSEISTKVAEVLSDRLRTARQGDSSRAPLGRAALALVAIIVSGSAQAHADQPFSQWWLSPLLVACAALYAVGVRRLWQVCGSARGIPKWRVAAFGAGWLAVVAALTDPLDALAQVSFAAHMAQHEILMLVAAPLLVLGNPLAAFVWALPLAQRHVVVRPFRSAWWQSWWVWLVTPPIAWSVHALTLWTWHAPAWFEAGLRHEWVHNLQHASFLAAALLFWWALVRRRPDGFAVLYVLTTLLHTGFLGALLTFAPNVWCPPYANAVNPWGLTALDDQQLSGLIMWVPAGAIFIVAGLLLLAQWLRTLEQARPVA